MQKYLALFLILCACGIFTGCVTDQRLNEEAAKKISFIRLDPIDSSKTHIGYQGPLGLLSQSVAVAIPGVGTGLAAGAGAVADDTYASDIDRVARQNQISLDKFLTEDIKKSFQAAGYTVKDVKEGGAVLRITDVTQLFHKLVGNPSLVAAASFELYLPAGPGQEKEEVLWHYRSVLHTDSEFPDYSYDELLDPNNLRKTLEATSRLLARDALRFLQEPAPQSNTKTSAR